MEAETCYLYIRDEYYGLIKLIENEIKKLESLNIIKKDFLIIRRGAGAYICGEESALIESIEGKEDFPEIDHLMWQRSAFLASLSFIMWKLFIG